MIDNFKLFGIEHIASIVIPIVLGCIFIILSKKFPKKARLIGIILAIFIFAIRSVRYVFDMQTGRFEVLDLLSLHICNINMYLLIFCLIWPNRKIFAFNFLVGIPTALAVVLMPGNIHPEPGVARAIFFIMSHMMLVMGAVYLLVVNRLNIYKKDLLFYYIFAFVGMMAVYIFNLITNANFMYLMSGPKGTVLEMMYQNLGSFLYILAIYGLLVSLFSFFYFIYILICKLNQKH